MMAFTSLIQLFCFPLSLLVLCFVQMNECNQQEPHLNANFETTVSFFKFLRQNLHNISQGPYLAMRRKILEITKE
jgi:hypothetical protein